MPAQLAVQIWPEFPECVHPGIQAQGDASACQARTGRMQTCGLPQAGDHAAAEIAREPAGGDRPASVPFTLGEERVGQNILGPVPDSMPVRGRIPRRFVPQRAHSELNAPLDSVLAEAGSKPAREAGRAAAPFIWVITKLIEARAG